MHTQERFPDQEEEAEKRNVRVPKKGETTESRDIWEALSIKDRGQGKQPNAQEESWV